MLTCSTPGCKKKQLKRRTVCASCAVNQYKSRHPVRYAFQVLRNNVKRRNRDRAKKGKAPIPFELTFAQFEKWCYETEILHGRGRTSTSFHIDRREDDKGYTIDNIQVLTNAENVTKENKRRKVVCYDHHYKLGFMVDTYNHKPIEDLPF